MSVLGPKDPSSWFSKLSSLFSENDAQTFAATLMSGEQGLGFPAYLDMMKQKQKPAENVISTPENTPVAKNKRKL